MPRVMPEEAKRILKMLADGKVTVDEAERLLQALHAPDAPAPEEPSRRELPRGQTPRFLRVVVNEEDKKVNVRLPIPLIRAGMKLTALIPKKSRADVRKRLSEQGIDIDLERLGPEDLDELVRHLADLQIDVEDGGKKTVRVFCE
jgi:hypothetical protein